MAAAKRTVNLQADLQTDEDFSNFITHKGLLVIEVYSEWCGPCLGMLSTLRRVKMDVGDGVSFAIAKCDTISYVNRFFKQSEPIWIFVNDGYAVNILFGTDASKLVRLIYGELKIPPNTIRNQYNISEPLPEEINRSRIKNEAKQTRILQERREREQKKFDYFKYVTDTIMENLPEIGVSIIGPHIHRDIFRKAIDFANEKFNIQCKDRRNQPITKEQFEIINTVCKNPLSANVIDAMDGKDLFIAFWKIPDYGNKRKVHEVLEEFADEVSKTHVLPPDEYRDAEEILPALLTSIKMKIEYELPDDQECPVETDSDMEPVSEPETPKDRKTQQQEDNETNLEELVSEIGSEEFEEPADDQKQSAVVDTMFDDIDITSVSNASVEDHIEEVVKKNICTRTVKIPGIWVPKDDRTHAALIYTIFRTQTVSFLPPDPLPEPPHVIMAFNTYKQRDLIDFAERYKDDIPLYGYFTSDDADEAQFIANSKQKYASNSQSASDKLVFKVNKRTSHTMLSLVTYGPTYVSCDTEVGKKEALKFFPESYISAEQELLQREQEMKAKETKKLKQARRDTESSVKTHREGKNRKAKEHGLDELPPHHDEEGIEAGAVPPEILEPPQDIELADRPPEGSEIPPGAEKPPEGAEKAENHENLESAEKSESPEKQEQLESLENPPSPEPAEPAGEAEGNPAPAVGETPT